MVNTDTVCNVVTCGHEEPGKPCIRKFEHTLWFCQQPAGRCEIHDESEFTA